MHNGFLQVEGEKMSKSLGNFFTIARAAAGRDWPGEVLRFNMLRTHYRQPIDWTVEGLEEAHQDASCATGIARSRRQALRIRRPGAAVLEALRDDLNTPQAIAELHELAQRRHRAACAGTALAPTCVELGVAMPSRRCRAIRRQ